MIVTILHNGKEIKHEVPTAWGQVNFNTFRKLEKADPLNVLSVFTGLEVNTLKQSTIKGFEEIAFALSFVSTTIDMNVLPKTFMGNPVPNDLNFDEVGRYWDIKSIYDSFVVKGEYKPDLSKFPEIVGIAVMPNYLETPKEKQDEFISRVGEQPCGEVLAIANFYLTRLILLNLRTAVNSSPTSTPKKSWRLAMINYLRNLVITVHLWRWRKILRSTETKSLK